jgi:membrane fusion protein (multidrug efflux system)
MTLKRWLVLLALLCGCPPGHAETPVPVGVVTAQTAAIHEEVALHGTLVAQRISRLSSEIDGLVEAIGVDDGDIVAPGAALVHLDRRLASIARDAATARLDEAQARYKEAGRRHAELAELRRTRNVASTAVATALAQFEIDAALVSQAESNLAMSREVLAQHTITAPFAAVVQRKLVEQGEWVETNTTLIELVDIDVLRLEVPVPQFYFADVAEGTRLSISLDALPAQIIESTVTRKIPIGDAASRTFRIRIDVPNRARTLAPGMSARVVLRLGTTTPEPVLVLPRDAIVRKPDGTASVWVIETEDGVSKAVPHQVRTGRTYRQFVEILDNAIAPGSQVVVRGNEILRPGQTVNVAVEHVGAHQRAPEDV